HHSYHRLIYLLSLHDALPIYISHIGIEVVFFYDPTNLIVDNGNTCFQTICKPCVCKETCSFWCTFHSGPLISVDTSNVQHPAVRSEEHTSELQSRENLVCRLL